MNAYGLDILVDSESLGHAIRSSNEVYTFYAVIDENDHHGVGFLNDKNL